MAKVILMSPPYVDLYGKLNKAAGRYFPLGLGYIASYLRKYSDHKVSMYEPEAQGLSYNNLSHIISSTNPDVIGLTCSTPNFNQALDLAELARKRSAAKIVIGGVHASAIPEFILDNYANLFDVVVVGEGEETMLELVNAWSNKKDITHIKGIVFRKNGKIINSGCRPFINNLDKIPFPARDLIPQELFRPNLHNARYKRCFTILTSRGCPFGCNFCAARIVSGRQYRFHSPEYVLEEIEMLIDKYQAQQLLITDDTFTLNRGRLEAICRGIIKRKLNIKWFCFSQVTSVDEKILRLMVKAGCYSIGFGVESADPGILRQMGKPILPKQAKKAIQLANCAGIKTQAFYILGMPGETLKSMKDTIRFADEVNATLSFFNMLVPYPGTKIFNRFFRGISLSKIPWENFVAVGEKCVLRNSKVPAREIERLIATANIYYYLKPKRILALLYHIRTPYEFFGYLRGALSLFKQVLVWRGSEKELYL